jgi:hypothetical protein
VAAYAGVGQRVHGVGEGFFHRDEAPAVRGEPVEHGGAVVGVEGVDVQRRQVLYVMAHLCMGDLPEVGSGVGHVLDVGSAERVPRGAGGQSRRCGW